jgi:hypothetical protein
VADVLKVDCISAEEIASRADSLYDDWQTMQPDEKWEIITEKIVIDKDEIAINLYYSPSCKDMAKTWRKGWVMRPFCHLVRRAARHDSHPRQVTAGKLGTWPPAKEPTAEVT